jgi:hypothetical protein
VSRLLLNACGSKEVSGSYGYVTSKPVRRPLLLAKASVSTPMRCIMLTNKLQSGALLSRLKAIC